MEVVKIEKRARNMKCSEQHLIPEDMNEGNLSE